MSRSLFIRRTFVSFFSGQGIVQIDQKSILKLTRPILIFYDVGLTSYCRIQNYIKEISVNAKYVSCIYGVEMTKNTLPNGYTYRTAKNFALISVNRWVCTVDSRIFPIPNLLPSVLPLEIRYSLEILVAH